MPNPLRTKLVFIITENGALKVSRGKLLPKKPSVGGEMTGGAEIRIFTDRNRASPKIPRAFPGISPALNLSSVTITF